MVQVVVRKSTTVKVAVMVIITVTVIVTVLPQQYKPNHLLKPAKFSKIQLIKS